jgi:hypothetical protein
VVATVLLSAAWPVFHAARQGGVSALLGPGTNSRAVPLLTREFQVLVARPGLGHDGQQFYAIARAPFRPQQMAPILHDPAYRYRRILYPLLGWVVAPHGGNALVLALAGIGLLGVGLSAASLAALPGARPWLPLIVAVTPGVVAALALTLSDSLALGFTLAAFAAAAHRRWWLVIVMLVLAVLGRESMLLAAFALALTPGMPARFRTATVAAPALALAGWTVWLDRTLAGAAARGAAEPFGLPFMGWIRSTDVQAGVLIGALLGAVMVVGAWRAGSAPQVRAYLVLLVALMCVLGPAVTESWINTSRAAVAGLPLSAWAISARA